MSTDLVLRPVAAADASAVVAHVQRVLAEYGIRFGVGSKTDDELSGLPGSYLSLDGGFWVAESRAGLVGTAGIVRVGQDAFELRKMYISSETRGHGVGRQLLDLAIAHARERGARCIVLDTVEQMETAIAFYEHHGFVRDDREIRSPRCTRGYRLDLSGPGK